MASIVLFLMIGHAVLAGLFWLLLQVPESNAWMVATSVLLVAVIVAAAAWVEGVALLSWETRETRLARMRRGIRLVPALLVALVPFAVLYYLTARFDTWHEAHSGEMDAWLIVHFKLVKSSLIHATIGWLAWFVRDVIGLSLALAIFMQAATSGWRSLARPTWLRSAFLWRRLATIALALVVLAWLPWQAVFWRPKGLPATWLEPAFVVVKLAVIYLLAHVGWALVLRAGARPARS